MQEAPGLGPWARGPGPQRSDPLPICHPHVTRVGKPRLRGGMSQVQGQKAEKWPLWGWTALPPGEGLGTAASPPPSQGP